MTTKTVKFMRDKSYPFHVENSVDGWAGSGFDKSYTEMKARKVADGEVQVEIKITEYKGDRRYVKHGSLGLSPELQAELLKVFDPALSEAN